MEITRLEDKDLNKFIQFCKKNLPKSFIYKKKFLKFWFQENNKKWLIDLVKIKEKIISINLRIKNKALINGKKFNFIWTSTAFTNHKNSSDPNIGLILLNIHRTSDIVGSLSPNKHSIKLNAKLGIKLKNIKLQRYIFFHNKNFINLIKNDKKKLLISTKIIKIKKNYRVKSQWVLKIPKDYNNLWKYFSSKFYLCIDKNKMFIEKRYLKNPYIKYNFLKILNLDNKLVGFAVIRFQKQKNISCARIIEYISLKDYEIDTWNEILYKNSKKDTSISDFYVLGNDQNANLKSTGFKKMTKKNIYYNIPSLLSPLDYRHWTDDFHIGGTKIRKIDQNKLKNLWFTKGDGDRDHPTNYDIKKKS